MEALQIIGNYRNSNDIKNKMESFNLVWRDAYGVSGCSVGEITEAKIIRIETARDPIEFVEAYFLTHRDEKLLEILFNKIKKTKADWTSEDWKTISEWSRMMGLGDLEERIKTLRRKEKTRYWAKKS